MLRVRTSIQCWEKGKSRKNLQMLTERNQRSNCQHFLDHRKSKGKKRKSKGVPEKHLLLLH